MSEQSADAKDLPVKHTFIQFNDHSPAMLPSKSTPGFRYGRAAFGIGEEEDCSVGGAVGGLLTGASYMPDDSPMMQGLESAKDEPAKIEASASLHRGRLWTLQSERSEGDAAEATSSELPKKSSLSFDPNAVDDEQPFRVDKGNSILSMRSVRFDDPGETPMASAPEPKSIAILEDKPEVVKKKSTRKKKKRAELPTPVNVQQKYGFVHFDEGCQTPGVMKTRTMPAQVRRAGLGDSDDSSGSEYETDSASSDGSWHSADSAAGTDFLVCEPCVIWKGEGLDRNAFLPQEEMDGQDRMRLSSLLACKLPDGRQANLGARVHALGRCVPCLMQCRFTSGRCKEPCRFGLLCNRCHEPHSEEELQKIQAQMRRLRKHKGNSRAS